MTPDEKTLSDAMHQVCGVVRSADIGNGIVATLRNGTITLTKHNEPLGPFSIVQLTDANIQGLEQFLVNIGWRCD